MLFFCEPLGTTTVAVSSINQTLQGVAGHTMPTWSVMTKGYEISREQVYP